MRQPRGKTPTQRDASRRGPAIAVVLIAVVAVLLVTAVVALRPRTDATPTASPTALACSVAPSAQPLKTATTAADATNLTLNTTCGPIVIRLLTREAPVTSRAMSSLASSDGLAGAPCYRLLTQVMYALQCGPSNGPASLPIPLENLPPDRPDNYRTGMVALGTDTSGMVTDQFFIAYRDFSLPPRFPVWGEVIEGLDIVQAIAAAGVRPGTTDAGSEIVAGEPLQPISIESARAGP